MLPAPGPCKSTRMIVRLPLVEVQPTLAPADALRAACVEGRLEPCLHLRLRGKRKTEEMRCVPAASCTCKHGQSTRDARADSRCSAEGRGGLPLTITHTKSSQPCWVRSIPSKSCSRVQWSATSLTNYMGGVRSKALAKCGLLEAASRQTSAAPLSPGEVTFQKHKY